MSKRKLEDALVTLKEYFSTNEIYISVLKQIEREIITIEEDPTQPINNEITNEIQSNSNGVLLNDKNGKDITYEIKNAPDLFNIDGTEIKTRKKRKTMKNQTKQKKKSAVDDFILHNTRNTGDDEFRFELHSDKTDESIKSYSSDHSSQKEDALASHEKMLKTVDETASENDALITKKTRKKKKVDNEKIDLLEEENGNLTIYYESDYLHEGFFTERRKCYKRIIKNKNTYCLFKCYSTGRKDNQILSKYRSR